MKLITVLAAFMLAASPVFATHHEGVSFKSPMDGAVVAQKFKVRFAVKGKKVRPAGEDPADKKSGHHHLIVDGSFVPEGQVVPTDETHLHFGKGQTETELKLAPGKHTLTLQLADGAHLSYGEAFSKTISVTVK